MKQRTFGRKMFFVLVAVLLVVGVSLHKSIAQQQTLNNQHSLDGRNGVRSGDGQPLRVTVQLNGKPWAKATVVINNADGTQAAKGVTDATGKYTNNSLSAGTYSVTASTVHFTATGSVTLVKSTDPAFVELKLAKKPAAAAAPAAK